MQYIPDGTEIVLWGLGGMGKRILSGEFGNYKISFAIDRQWKQRQIEIDEMENTESIVVYSPDILDEISLNNKMLVVGICEWHEIARDLEEKGKHIFRDYVPYVYLKVGAYLDAGFLRFCKNDTERKALLKKFSFGRKLCAMYGFCHMSIYKSWLLKSKDFIEKYCLLDIPYANVYDDKSVLLMPDIYYNLDLLILGCVYPREAAGNPDWRTIKSWINNEKCEVILVTRAAFDGYFPQSIRAIPETYDKISYGDKNIDKMIQEGKSADEILHILSSPSFYSPEQVNHHYERALKKLELNESWCDIRISDYIREYGKQTNLMYGLTHPRECVMRELTRRIFGALGLDTELLAAEPENDSSFSLPTGAIFIYPSVYQALGIPEREEQEKLYVGLGNVPVGFSEYIDMYVKHNKPYLSQGM